MNAGKITQQIAGSDARGIRAVESADCGFQTAVFLCISAGRAVRYAP